MSSRFTGIVSVIAISLLLNKHLVNVHGWRPFVVHVDELITEAFSPKCRVNSSITYPGLMNVYLDVLGTVKIPFSHIEIFLQSADGIYDLEIMNRTVDVCRLFRDLTYEPILQVGYKLYKSNSNFLTSCFIKKRAYSIKNLKLNVEQLPPMFPEKSGYYSQTYFLNKTHAFFKVKLFFSVNKVYKKNN